MEQTLKIFKALSDKNRLRITACLFYFEELCACQITELLQVTGATVSRHLSQLSASGILDSRKEGRWIFYFIRPEMKKERIIPWIEERVQASEQFKSDMDALKAITACDPEEICRKQRGEACCPVKKD